VLRLLKGESCMGMVLVYFGANMGPLSGGIE